MLRLGLLLALALAVPSLLVAAELAGKAPAQKRTVERFLNGTDADRDAMLKDVVKAIAAGGYRDVAMVPWLVMMAKNRRGTDVVLLVDPVTLVTLELDHGSETDAAAAAETVIPKLRH